MVDDSEIGAAILLLTRAGYRVTKLHGADVLDEIEAMRFAGKSNPEIVEALGISRGVIQRCVKSRGLPKKIEPAFRWTDERLNMLIGMRRSGMRVKDISSRLGCSEKSVRLKCHRSRILSGRKGVQL